MKPRNFQVVADEITKIIYEECTFNKDKVYSIVQQIEKVQKDNRYKAPELQYESWDELSSILSKNFVPSNSKWETKLMIVFNNLHGSIDDYWDDDNNELRRVTNESNKDTNN